MAVKMLINAVDEEEYRVAMIKEGLLEGFYVETATAEQKVGNIYKGIVEHIQPSLQHFQLLLQHNKSKSA